jgi:recombination endonuclease VII
MGTPYAKMTPEQKARAHEANKRWKERNPKKSAAYKHAHYVARRERYLGMERERAYLKRYGISIADYEAMLAKQGGRCAICQADKAGKKGQFFAVDHCHKTAAVRGLLCVNCNVHLGWLERHGAAAAAYLTTTT